MADVIIKVFRNGPYVIEGSVKLLDHQDGEYPVDVDRRIALCRCGQSSKRPFCDGTHKRCDFTSEETAS